MAYASNPFDAFASLVLPADLPDQARAYFAELARSHPLPQNSAVEASRKTDSLAFVATGAAKLVAHASAEREQVIAFYFAGDILVMPGRGTHSYSLHALRESDVLLFPYRQFLEAAHEHPGILRPLLERSNLSLQRCREKTIALGRKTAMERVVAFLLLMSERIGVVDEGGMTLDLPMSRRDIADSLGLTIETVSRQLTHLRQDGSIETVGRSKIILRLNSELEARAGYLREVA